MNKKSETLQAQVQALTSQIQSASGEDLVGVLIAKNGIKSGTVFDPSTVEVRQWNRKYLSPNLVLDSSLLQNQIWKINVSKESPITADMLTKESFSPTDRLHLVLVDAVTPSIEIGDYVDIRMITPYGISYVVMSKKRIVNIYDSGIEIVMSEAELMVYQGLLIDQYMNPGTMVYTDKYLDPTLQKAMYTMYVPPKDILDYMRINANMLYPYLASDDVQGLRSYIESTQPWTLYGPSTFQSVTQGIIDRQMKITQANSSIGNAMKAARSQFIQRQSELAQKNGGVYINQGQATSQIPRPIGSTGSGQGSVTYNPDGTYTDANGVRRNSSGQPILSPSDLVTGATPIGTNRNTTAPVQSSPSSTAGSYELNSLSDPQRVNSNTNPQSTETTNNSGGNQR